MNLTFDCVTLNRDPLLFRTNHSRNFIMKSVLTNEPKNFLWPENYRYNDYPLSRGNHITKFAGNYQAYWVSINYTWDGSWLCDQKSNIGIISFLEATTVANFVTIKQTGHEILSRQHLGFRPAVWHWPFHDQLTGIQ